MCFLFCGLETDTFNIYPKKFEIFGTFYLMYVTASIALHRMVAIHIHIVFYC